MITLAPERPVDQAVADVLAVTVDLSEQSHPPGCQCLWCAPWRDDR